jgi:hypothetical protein
LELEQRGVLVPGWDESPVEKKVLARSELVLVLEVKRHGASVRESDELRLGAVPELLGVRETAPQSEWVWFHVDFWRQGAR